MSAIPSVMWPQATCTCTYVVSCRLVHNITWHTGRLSFQWWKSHLSNVSKLFAKSGVVCALPFAGELCFWNDKLKEAIKLEVVPGACTTHTIPKGIAWDAGKGIFTWLAWVNTGLGMCSHTFSITLCMCWMNCSMKRWYFHASKWTGCERYK